jgi:HSP20 family protein
MMLRRWFDDAFFPSFSFDFFRSFDDDFIPAGNRLATLWSQAQSAVSPRVYAHETDTDWILLAEVPGMKQSDLDISVQRGFVTLRGERHSSVPENWTPRIQERVPLKFAHQFALPKSTNPDEAEAKLEDGILTLRVPKTPEAEPRQIPIKTTETA